jgi:anaerobic selenocysteine-containing dehydrogenase
VASQVGRERMTGPNDFALIPTFRLPVLVHTRTGNAKWLNEIAHANPVWIHPIDAARIGVRNGDLVRVETDSGHLVNRAWVTEGIRPGVVACSHHMGRWRLDPEAGTDRWSSGQVDLRQAEPGHWTMRRLEGASVRSPTRTRADLVARCGVHQNLSSRPPDPISAHAWHQKVAVRRPVRMTARATSPSTRALRVYPMALPHPWGPGPVACVAGWLLRPRAPRGCLSHAEVAARAGRDPAAVISPRPRA